MVGYALSSVSEILVVTMMMIEGRFGFFHAVGIPADDSGAPCHQRLFVHRRKRMAIFFLCFI